jgi:hypothetical protein
MIGRSRVGGCHPALGEAHKFAAFPALALLQADPGKEPSLYRQSCRLIAVAALAVAAALGSGTAMAQAPELQLPPVPTPPPIPTPPPLPPVPTPPPLPKLPVPVPEPPSPAPTPSGGASPAPATTPAAQPSAPQPSPAAEGPQPSAPRDAQRPSAAPTASQPAASTPTARARTGTRTTAAPPAPRLWRELRLRRAVARLSGCLDTIGGMQRRVLVLRTGIGAARPHSRRAVAERLHATVRHVARAERNGLRALRRSARAGRCGTAVSGVAPAAPDGAPPPSATGAGAADPDSRAADRPAVSGVQEEFRSSDPPDAPATLLPSPADADEPPMLLLLAAAFLAGFAAVWAFERRRGSASRRGPPTPRRS